MHMRVCVRERGREVERKGKEERERERERKNQFAKEKKGKASTWVVWGKKGGRKVEKASGRRERGGG